MKDKELFTYFKSKSNTFEEMPSSDLWLKIEQELQQNLNSSFNLKNIIFKIFFSIIVVTSISFLITSKVSKTIDKESIFKKDTIKKVKQIMPYDSVGTFQKEKLVVKEKNFEPKTFISKSEMKHKFVKDSIKSEKTYSLTSRQIQLKIINSKSLAADKEIIENDKIIGFGFINKDSTLNSKKPEIIPTKAIQANDNIIFKTNKELSKEEYQLFVKELKERNKDSIGKTLIIKARGYNTQRFTIEPIQYKTKMIE